AVGRVHQLGRSRPRGRSVLQRRQWPVPRVELLEGRSLPSVSVVFNAASGALAVTSDAADAITVATKAVDGTTLVTVNGAPTAVAAAVHSLSVTGGPGDNAIALSGVTPADFTSLGGVVIQGGDGADSIVGSQFGDQIDGGPGNDAVAGGTGNDVLRG